MLAAAAWAQELPEGFEHFYNLEYDLALREFEQLARERPNDPNAYNHVAQTVLYRELFRAGALETELVSGGNPFLRRPKVQTTPATEKFFFDQLNKSIALSQAALQKNPKDTQALYSLGVAHGLRANYNFLVRKAWRDALRDGTEARKLHNQATAVDPTLTDARLVQGVHDYVVGSLPWHWKLLGFLIGFRGDREAGIRTLELVANQGRLNRYDAQVLLAAIYRRERKADKAIPLLSSFLRRFPRNYLARLEIVQMYGDLGRKEPALAQLAEIERLKRSGAPGFASLPMEKIFYYRGNLLFWYNELDQAIENLRRVTTKAGELDLNTGVMAWMRLGQSYDLKGRRNEAIDAYRKAIAVAPQSEAAKESQRYISNPYRRG
ncbi:MAG: tetratricopeptide repeat protein [Acidobacteria bacterium]|nr:tetratricopeptide repeat protein [Acidobacteriota bacterium]